jgi:hypothetical protein
MRYFSARKAAPAALDEAAIDAYMRYRAQTTAFATDAGARRSIARAWNGCIGVIKGWPECRLLEPAIKTTEGPEWEKGAVGELVGIDGGVISGVINLESSGVEASDWRPRHDERYHEA